MSRIVLTSGNNQFEPLAWQAISVTCLFEKEIASRPYPVETTYSRSLIESPVFSTALFSAHIAVSSTFGVARILLQETILPSDRTTEFTLKEPISIPATTTPYILSWLIAAAPNAPAISGNGGTTRLNPSCSSSALTTPTLWETPPPIET